MTPRQRDGDGDVDDDLLFEGERFRLRAIRRPNGRMPAKEWVDELDDKGAGQLLAALQILDTTLSSGRPPAGRAEKVKDAKYDLWELKITKPGSSPPHLRLLYVREGRTLWAAHGFTKQKSKLESKDIRRAESVVAQWLEERG